MKNYLLPLLFILGSSILWSQSRIRVKEYPDEIREITKQSADCRKEGGDDCAKYLYKALKIAKEKKSCVPCIEIELARAYYFDFEMDSMVRYAKLSIENSDKLRDSIRWELLSDAYNLLSIDVSFKGENEKTVQYMMESIHYAEKMGNEIQVALMKSNLGLTYNNFKNHEKGIALLEESFSELLRLKSPNKKGALAANIAGAYIDISDYESAIDWSRRTIKLSVEEEDKASEAAGFYLLASALQDLKKDSALYYVNQSIELLENIQDARYLASSHNVKANILADFKNYPEAKINFLKSIQYYEELGNPAGMDAALKNFGRTAYEFKDYETAARYLNEYIVYNDSVISEENRILLHDMETKYETEKKEKQIAEQDLKIQKQKSNLFMAILGGTLLISILGGLFWTHRRTAALKFQQLQKEKENAILSSFIQGEERERNRISHELHDGVAAMIGAAKMSLDALPHLSAEKQQEQLFKIKGILDQTHADVRHIAHNLLPSVLEKEGIIQATRHFASEINATKLIKISVADEDSRADELPKQLQLMLFRVIQELINNIIKHSQADNATIEFSRNENGLLQLEVNDDGIGFDGTVDSGSQGLYSISQRLKSIGGNFKFIRKKDRGMSAIAELKV